MKVKGFVTALEYKDVKASWIQYNVIKPPGLNRIKKHICFQAGPVQQNKALPMVQQTTVTLHVHTLS